MTSSSPIDRATTRMRIIGASVVLTLGALHAWAGRHMVNIDGVSYLDIGDALTAGDWTGSVNAHWSPLYAWLLGVVMAIVNPSPYWEFAAAHIVNFAIFAATLAAFDMLLRAVIAHQRRTTPYGWMTLPGWAWVGLGYLLFLWASLQLIELWILTPDLALSACIYLAAAFVLRMHRSELPRREYVMFGAVLALGYLVKAPMFVFAFMFLALAWIASGATLAAGRKVALAAVVFLVLSAPFVTALSISKGRLTFGESRTLAFAWFVNQVPFRHWQGGYPGDSSALHPTRKVLDAPAVYEFSTPIGGTYPAWYDPSYWYDGIRPDWNIEAIAATLGANARELSDMFVSYVQVSLLAGVVVLMMLGRASDRFGRALAGQWPLLMPAIAGLAVYSLVSVFPRYVAPFMLLLWLGVLSAVQLRGLHRSARALAGMAVVLMVVMSALLAAEIGPAAAEGARAMVAGEDPRNHLHWQVADGLRRAGLQPGDRVAWVHPGSEDVTWSGMTGWARLTRARIVAEVPPESSGDFWTAMPDRRARVLDAFKAAGAAFVVTLNAPPAAERDGWERVGETDYFALRLQTRAADLTPIR